MPSYLAWMATAKVTINKSESQELWVGQILLNFINQNLSERKVNQEIGKNGRGCGNKRLGRMS